jgi:hypothetical protein
MLYENKFGWMDVWELNPEWMELLWLKACATCVCVCVCVFWLKASMIREGGPFPFFSYILEFSLKLSKITEEISQGSRLVLDTSRCFDLAAFLQVASTSLLSISAQLPVGDFSQPLVCTSALQVAELRVLRIG